LCVAREPKQNDARDLVLDWGGKRLDWAVHDGASLTRRSRALDSSFSIMFTSWITHLYPPATILEFGHLESAKSKSVVAAPISVGLVFWGKKLFARVASYGEPTPWHPTTLSPRADFRSEHTWGPTMVPCLG
jgi:hypothetical protein